MINSIKINEPNKINIYVTHNLFVVEKSNMKIKKMIPRYDNL